MGSSLIWVVGLNEKTTLGFLWRPGVVIQFLMLQTLSRYPWKEGWVDNNAYKPLAVFIEAIGQNGVH